MSEIIINPSEKPIFICQYAQFGIIIQTIALSPLYILSVWYLITSETLNFNLYFSIVVATFIGLMNFRSLIRLGETIVVTEDKIIRLTWFNRTHILWSEVKQVKTYKSWLERDCFRIESANEDRISVSEMLTDYGRLYKTLENKIPSSQFVN